MALVDIAFGFLRFPQIGWRTMGKQANFLSWQYCIYKSRKVYFTVHN